MGGMTGARGRAAVHLRQHLLNDIANQGFGQLHKNPLPE
jgi:hypothetical protein